MRCCSSSTDFPSVIYKSVAEVTAFLGRDNFPESHFNFLRLLNVVYKSHSVYKSYAVSVSYNGRLAKNITHYKVGTFSSNSRKF